MPSFRSSALVAGLLCVAAMTCPATARELAITNARIVAAPDAEPIASGTVLLRDGRITAVGDSTEVAVPEGVERLDAGGGTVVAGFWNSHVHLIAPPLDRSATQPGDVLSEALLTRYLRWGFSTIFDIASPPGSAFVLRARIEDGDVTGPAILTTGTPFFPMDGVPAYLPTDLGGWSLKQAEVATPEEAAGRARRQLAAGADGLKIFAGAMVGGELGVLPMDDAIGKAVGDIAREAGKPLFAHPGNQAGVDAAIAAGTSVFAHTAPLMGPWDDALVQRLLAEDIALIPTLKLIEIEVRKEGGTPEVVERVMAVSRQQLEAFSRAGGTVLFGTDSGYIDWYDTRDELRQMHASGLDWRQVLASLTTAPAQRFGQAGRKGRLAPGMDADLVVLGGDPAEDVAVLADVRYTLRAGKVVYAAGP
ncbi:amidohydrolase family protein [Luteimonas wenzhouensis]|uniref:Amidohydrolase family protein n=1 Tax=Luteimonas wenzhouensis TaxID=2599615 RepID=A0A5C5U5P0_9GAMM|nr:amidohydrolase family protein [Luteimonas wenzhouensis]TWT20610.1 amidohydrolase family protein [Luteimonas wenzhouensis]